MEEELKYRVGILELKPDDVLVLKVDQRVTFDVANKLRQYVRNSIGSDRKVLVLEEGLDISVLTQPEIEARIGVAVEASAVMTK